MGTRGIFVVKQRFWNSAFPAVCLFSFVCVGLADSAVRADSSASLKELLRLK